ncbi:MAG: amidohydrolase [Lysinibacillus sp.]
MESVVARNEYMQSWFEHFHNNPEVSWKEHATTRKISNILTGLCVKHHTFDDVTGVIAEIGTGDEVIAVRADIDALWQEVDGEMRANHSCGHDAHITMVLGALVGLMHEPLNKRIRFIFQPAEETGSGSVSMIERGALEDVTHLFGVHLRPIEELPLGKVAPAIYHGAAAFLEGSIKGVDAHGARPHQGKNALDVVFAMQQALQTLHINPFKVYSAKLTKVVADGGSVNIIPGNATFSMDVRAQENEVLKDVQQKIEMRLNQIASNYDVEVNWQWVDITPGAKVGLEAMEIARQSITSSVGLEALAAPVHTPGSDDFHFYTIHKPELEATMIAVGANLVPGLHHPKMTFDHSALYIGADVLTATLKTAAKGSYKNEY